MTAAAPVKHPPPHGLDRFDGRDTCAPAGAGMDQAWRLRALVASMAGETQGAIQNVPKLKPPSSSRLLAQPRRVPVLAICSGKGGVGKTNLAVNLSIVFSQMGIRATLFDADLGMANADVLCGMTPSRRLDDVLCEAQQHSHSDDQHRIDLSSCVVRGPGGFLLVPGAVGVARIASMNQHQRNHLVDQLATLETRSDVIVIDTGAGIGHNVLTFGLAADMVMVVVTPEPTSITDAYSLIKCLSTQAKTRHQPMPQVGLVLSQTRKAAQVSAVATRMIACCQRFLGLRPVVLGQVQNDAHVGKAVRQRQPIVLGWPRARASKDIRLIATTLQTTIVHPSTDIK